MKDETKENTNQEEEKELAIPFFQLDAVTLRGIGSYFHEARLEIKPLTILCGQNGSGKSTWFKVLKYLKERSANNLFPLYFLPFNLPNISDYPSIVNSNVMTSADSFERKEDYKPKIDAVLQLHNPEEAYGPLSTIGVELTAINDMTVSTIYKKGRKKYRQEKSKGNPSNFEENLIDFIYNGHVRKGSHFCLRISLRSEFNDSGFGEDKVSQIEMFKDGVLLFKFTSNHLIIHQLFIQKADKQEKKMTHNYDILSIGLETIRKKVIPKNKKINDKEDFRKFMINMMVYKARFSLEELQKIYENLNILIKSSRNYNIKLSLYCLQIFKSIIEKALSNIFILSANRSPLDDSDKRWWNNKNTEKIIESRNVGEFGENTIIIERSYAKTAMIQYGIYKEKEILERLERKLEEIKGWKSKSENEKNKIRNRVLNPPKIGVDLKKKMDEKESKELINVMLDQRFHFLMHYSHNFMGYITPLYVRYWLDKIGICKSDYFFDRKQIIDDFIFPPSGFHFYKKPEEVRDNEDAFFADAAPIIGNVDRYCQSTLTLPGGVSGLSSGFHHLLPIIVQSSVMWPSELLCVESPEIHLHPTMQLKITEFFIEQAKSGRRYILETHSDLIVRRTLRAILEEELAQKDINIYFTKLERIDQHPALSQLQEPVEELTSMLELIKVNDKGQIVNWPEGFLDADVIESRRLIGAMYGAVEGDETQRGKYEQSNE